MGVCSHHSSLISSNYEHFFLLLLDSGCDDVKAKQINLFHDQHIDIW